MSTLWWLSLLWGCGSPCPEGADLVYKGNESGRVRACVQEDGTLDGSWQEQRLDGSVSLSGAYAAGKPTGTWTRTHASGETASEETFVDGLSDGPVKRWSADGVLLLDGTYARGKADGRWRFWRKDGSKAREVVYRDGQPTDEVVLWSATGVEVESCLPVSGAEPRVHCTLHHPDGSLSAEGDRLNGVNDGPWTYRFPSGVKSLEETWSGGRRVGPTQRWHASGSLAESGTWDTEGRGTRVGWWKRWTSEGAELPDVAFGVWSPGAAVRGAVEHPDPRARWQFHDASLGEPAGAGRLGDLTVIAADKRVIGLFADGETAAFHGLVPVAVRAQAPAVLSDTVAYATTTGHVLMVREEGWELHAAGLPDDAELYGVGKLLVAVTNTGLQAFDSERAWTRATAERPEVLAVRSDALWIREGDRELRVSPDAGAVGAPSSVPAPGAARLVDGRLMRDGMELDPGPWRFLDATVEPWLLTGPSAWVVALDPSSAEVTVSSKKPAGAVRAWITSGGATLPGAEGWRTYTWERDGVEHTHTALDTRGWALRGDEVYVHVQVTPEQLEAVEWHNTWTAHSPSQALLTRPVPMLPLWATPKPQETPVLAVPDAEEPLPEGGDTGL